MKKHYTFLLICLLTVAVNTLSAQEQRQVIFQGEKKVKGSEVGYIYYFTKGDKVLITLKTEKDKEIKFLVLENYHTDRKVLSLEKPSTMEKTVIIPEDGVYFFQLKGKAMSGRECSYSINRLGDNLKNVAYTKKQQYTSETVEWKIDSMIGYKEPEKSYVNFRLFDQYYNVKKAIYSTDRQIMGKAGIHNSRARLHNLDMNVSKPENGIFKGYNYQFSSTLGGAQHWEFAKIGTDVLGIVASSVLSPAAGFAVAGTMAAIGPEIGKEPAQYYMLYNENNFDEVERLYSLDKTQREARNLAAKIGNELPDMKILGKIIGKEEVFRPVFVPSENDFSFNEKGKVTGMSIFQAKKPEAKYFVTANPEHTQAKNYHLEASAIYYVPGYKTVKVERSSHKIITTEVPKSTTNYTRRSYVARLDY